MSEIIFSLKILYLFSKLFNNKQETIVKDFSFQFKNDVQIVYNPTFIRKGKKEKYFFVFANLYIS